MTDTNIMINLPRLSIE